MATIEEKAKAYDIALDKIKRLLGTGSNCSREELEYVFPELVESQDEKIRKTLLNYLYYVHKDDKERADWIAWLEKQAEQPKKHDVCDTCDEKDNCISPCCVKLVEEQGRQKPANKAELKFNVGDWVVCESAPRYTAFKIGDVVQISSKETLKIFLMFKDCFRPWTIQDAKDGDVLVVENIIFIYRRTLASHIVSYCKLINDIFEPFEDARTCCEGNSYVHPATKEQCDLLFQKITEAGYEWNSDKKELKKIEQKQEWSEEDKRKINRIYSILQQAADTHAFSTSCRLIGDKECIELQDFLKSIIPQSQWKPSDEQLKHLSKAIIKLGTLCNEDGCETILILDELFEKLKKLREE